MPGEEIDFTTWPKIHSPLLGTDETYFACHIGPNFQISLIYALIGCPQSVTANEEQKLIIDLFMLVAGDHHGVGTKRKLITYFNEKDTELQTFRF